MGIALRKPTPMRYAQTLAVNEHVPIDNNPTPQRVAKALAYDRGDPHNRDAAHTRAARLVTPWDRYQHPDKDGKTVLDALQILAGNHYATDYDKAGYGKVRVGGYEPTVNGSSHDTPEWVWEARNDITSAQRLLRPHEIELLHSVLFNGHAAKEWAKNTGRHYRLGIAYLKDILDILAPHYGYVTKGRGHSHMSQHNENQPQKD